MKARKIIIYSLLVFFIAVFLFCAVQVGSYLIRSAKNKQFYQDLSAMHTTAPSGGTQVPGTRPPNVTPTLPQELQGEPDATVPPASSTAPQRPILPELENIHAMNNHVVGWIKIEGTNVDYPVMQTPDTKLWRDYYLYRDFMGQDNKHGSIYVRESCDVFRPSDNITIYGHNMADFSMFGHLYQYASYNFYKDHKYIQFDTLYERHTYEIFAVFRTSGTYGVGFAYHMFSQASDQAAFDEFVAQCKSLSRFETGITPQYGDKLICLSTCDFHIDNGRLVLVAVRID